jgi:hypothetical protein
MDTQCIICGKEAEQGGFTSRIEGHILRPLCSRCQELCTSQVEVVLKEYPWLFERGTPSTSQVKTSPTQEDVPAQAYHNGEEAKRPVSVSPPAHNPAIDRYLDLYRTARSQVTIGTFVKVIGVVLGVVIFLFWLLIGVSSSASSREFETGATIFGGSLIGGLIVGAIVGGLIFLFGVMISAQGQALLVLADAAIHTSPFLTADEKARAMSLPFPPKSYGETV